MFLFDFDFFWKNITIHKSFVILYLELIVREGRTQHNFASHCFHPVGRYENTIFETCQLDHILLMLVPDPLHHEVVAYC